MQFSELTFRDADDTPVDLTAASATSNGASLSNEGPPMAIDGSTSTKWLSSTCCPDTLTVTFAAPTSIGQYDLWTADDASDRDPTAWDLECSKDGSEPWVLLDARTGVTPPSARYTAYGLGAPGGI